MKKAGMKVASVALAALSAFAFTSCKKDDKELIGFDIDLAKKTVAYLNETYDVDLEVEFVEIDWSTKEAKLADGTLDLVWNGMTITEERSAEMCISVPYLYNKQVAVIMKSDAEKYTTKESMADAIMTAETGSAGESVVQDQDLGAEYVVAPSQLDALMKLDKGEADVAVIDSVMAGYYTSTGDYASKMQIVDGLVFAEESYGIAAKKGNNALMSKINEALIAIRTTGYAEVVAQYGLTSSVALNADTVDVYAGATDDSWANVVSSGKLVIGYTIFAPIAYEKD
ncbi:MAG: transporter substrate-binding domain-containing protein [Clostridia bacterium]|nr:transporter substrate-binding domain-containing protein [Clostridia bacterium]